MLDFGKAVKNFLFRTIGLPDESDIITCKALIQFNRLSKIFIPSARIEHEGNKDELRRKIRLENLFLRTCIIFTIFRINVSLFVDNYYIDLFLANPFSGNKSTKGFFFLIQVDLVFICLFVLREYCLHLEETGRFKVFRVFHHISKNGLSRVSLGLSYRQCKKFHKTIHNMMFHSIRIILITTILMTISVMALKVHNFSSTFIHLIFILVYTPIECVSAIPMFVNVMCYTMYCGSYLALNLSRFNTLQEIIKKNSLTISYNCTALRLMNNRVVYFLNHFDRIDSYWKYLFQCYFIVVLPADFGLFFAIILDFDSDILSLITALNSIIVHIAVIASYYWFSHFYHETIDMHKRYVSIILHSGSASLVDKLKALEILDRTGSPHIGVSIGDFCRLKRSTCIFYLLENASFLMLLTCNIRV
uniref:Gustatory receptor n=1 Tax=Tetranychus urticae TaxID=32264 RepID=T1L5A4_TETUR